MTAWPPYPATVTPRRPAYRARAAWVLLPAQVVLTGAVTYVVIAAWSVIGGVFTEGLQVVGFAIVSTPLTILVFVLGLPLRVVPRVRSWWCELPWVVVVVLAVAVVGIALSFVVPGAGPVHNEATDEWVATDGYDPNPWVFLPALGLLAFALMHLLPPRVVTRRMA